MNFGLKKILHSYITYLTLHYKSSVLICTSVFFSAILVAQAKDTIQPASNLIAQGIPEIPQSVKQGSGKYSEARAAIFADWHPVKKEMLIATRFGNTSQIHQVKIPGGARTQVTFFDEGITTASYEPVAGNYFLFLKDVGGNEFGQIYRYDFKDGTITLLTDGGRSQNGDILWSNSGRQIAYSSTLRNGTDRDIYTMDPLHPESSKLLLKVEGGGWSISDWSPDDKNILLIESISANESHIWMVNLETGEKKIFTPANEKGVSYDACFFGKDGKGIYLTTDKEGEFKRLAYAGVSSKHITTLTSSINWDVSGPVISKDGKLIAFTVNESGISKLFIYTIAIHQYKEVKNIPTGIINDVLWHADGQTLGLSIQTFQGVDVND